MKMTNDRLDFTDAEFDAFLKRRFDADFDAFLADAPDDVFVFPEDEPRAAENIRKRGGASWLYKLAASCAVAIVLTAFCPTFFGAASAKDAASVEMASVMAAFPVYGVQSLLAIDSALESEKFSPSKFAWKVADKAAALEARYRPSSVNLTRCSSNGDLASNFISIQKSAAPVLDGEIDNAPETNALDVRIGDLALCEPLVLAVYSIFSKDGE